MKVADVAVFETNAGVGADGNSAGMVGSDVRVGENRWVVEPSPICPKSFRPQHQSEESAEIAQVLLYRPEVAAHEVVEEICTGVYWAAVESSPI